MEWVGRTGRRTDNKETTAVLQHSLQRNDAKDAENRRQESRGKVGSWGIWKSPVKQIKLQGCTKSSPSQLFRVRNSSKNVIKS